MTDQGRYSQPSVQEAALVFPIPERSLSSPSSKSVLQNGVICQEFKFDHTRTCYNIPPIFLFKKKRLNFFLFIHNYSTAFVEDDSACMLFSPSVCKSCIVKYLMSCKHCPQCQLKVHETHPLFLLRPDRTLQDIVYKLIPNLFESKYYFFILIYLIFKYHFLILIHFKNYHFLILIYSLDTNLFFITVNIQGCYLNVFKGFYKHFM